MGSRRCHPLGSTGGGTVPRGPPTGAAGKGAAVRGSSKQPMSQNGLGTRLTIRTNCSSGLSSRGFAPGVIPGGREEGAGLKRLSRDSPPSLCPGGVAESGEAAKTRARLRARRPGVPLGACCRTAPVRSSGPPSDLRALPARYAFSSSLSACSAGVGSFLGVRPTATTEAGSSAAFPAPARPRAPDRLGGVTLCGERTCPWPSPPAEPGGMCLGAGVRFRSAPGAAGRPGGAPEEGGRRPRTARGNERTPAQEQPEPSMPLPGLPRTLLPLH